MSFPDTDLARAVRAYLKDLETTTETPWTDAGQDSNEEETGQ